MKMIIGGAFQGQLEWAKERYPEIGEEQWIDGKRCEIEEIYTCKGIYDFQEYIRKVMVMEEKEKKEKNGEICSDGLAKELIRRNPEVVIVSDEIGSGLVPVDGFERAYRERTGRICTELAGFSEEVIRVVMGIGNHIKG